MIVQAPVPLRLLLAAVVLSLSSPAAARPGQGRAVHAIVGDRSWVELHGAPPPESAPEDERIAVHLGWVEARLRAAEVGSLSEAASAARAAALDDLRAYRSARAFPRWHGQIEGRAPRWIDADGRHCAVAALVRASGDDALVDAVQRAHEVDLVRDMRVPALAAWAAAHGFTIDELALIQPTYDDGSGVHIPSESEERRAREERERAARIPRPLTHARLREVRLDAHGVARECPGARPGHWSMVSTLRVDPGLAIRVSVRVVAVGGRERAPVLERCAAGLLEEGARALVRSARYTLRGAIEVRHAQTFRLYAPHEIEAAVLADDRRPWHGSGTRREALAACMARRPDTAPLRVPVRVQAWDGEVRIRWDEVSADPLAMPEAERELWHCIQSVIGYGRLPEHGVSDHDVPLVLTRDGALLLAPR